MKYAWQDIEALKYGIVGISVANLRAWPVFQSELINQTLMGTIVPIFEEKEDFYFIRNWDDYRGWISKHSLVIVSETEAHQWEEASHAIVQANYGVVRAETNEQSEILSDLVPCIRLKYLGKQDSYVKVGLPDGRVGYVQSNILLKETEFQKIKATKQTIITTALRFPGIPYLWGGTSAKGFDCSGFVQTVFRLLNVTLPRDTGPMSRIGEAISIENNFDALQTGDLIFFGKSPQRINHVALYLNDGLFIHSRGRVRLNSLMSDHPLYDADLNALIVKAVRIRQFE